MKYAEKEAMKGYIETEKCLSRYIVNLLDDTLMSIVENVIIAWLVRFYQQLVPSLDEISVVAEYLDSIYIEIEPRKRWPQTNMGLGRKVSYNISK